MAKDAVGTLKQIAAIGFKEIESARSKKGLYYGLSPIDMNQICDDLGMKLTSGHVALDDNFQTTMEEAVASGQEYVICSSMPSSGQTIDNYKKVAEQFNLQFEEMTGSNELIQKMVAQNWDTDFVIARPGETVAYADFKTTTKTAVNLNLYQTGPAS